MMSENLGLVKSLKLPHVVFMGLAWMTPMIYFTIYGVAYEAAEGKMAVAYIVAFLAIFFTAYSYSRMVKAYPIAGSAYTYTKNSIHPKAGFLVGWALLIDYVFSPIIAILTFGIFMNTEFPAIPTYVWIIIMNIVLAVVNILGIKSAARISGISVLLQIGFIFLFCMLIIKDILAGEGTSSILTLAPFFGEDAAMGTIFSGAALICFCFLGFDAVTTMAEETVDAQKTIPKAIFLIIFIAAIMYISISYLIQIAYPDFTFVNADNAAYSLVRLIGGNLLSSLFIMVLIVATFTQGLSSVTSVSRFLYALGRESILPKKLFTSLHPKYKTPVSNIIFIAVISLSAVFISLNSAVLFVSFGALTAFIFVNLSVIAHFYIKLKKRSPKETFLYLVFPLVGATFIGWLLTLLDLATLKFGVSWIMIGFVYLFIKKWSKAKERKFAISTLKRIQSEKKYVR
ncbi:amino acid permease [Peribacillus simplex]|uniref:Amino acid permease n=2 Tax=Bacillaceae TaxID=186817 RepID=A0AAN2TS41_9BACI|nr:APC family permease [Peribacillus frigoritolerans]MCP1152164.1 APC family permease [Peribacillus frigoritolerans]CEG31583.1 amino acid permease [Peribacillus simplex]